MPDANKEATLNAVSEKPVANKYWFCGLDTLQYFWVKTNCDHLVYLAYQYA